MDLRAGDRVLITGTMLTGRDAAHKRLVDLIQKGEKLPVDLKGQIIYFVGPTPTRPGEAIGSAGPTTSYRMDAYSPILIERGLKGMIGKGSRSREVVEAMVRHKAVYFAAVGGAAALISRRILSSEILAYEDLGPEAIRRLQVKDFPVIVVNDTEGNDLYEQGVKEYAIG
ncbi:MAG: Fe-S-containing hydro-lyase [bacterium]|nr:MAG: Fe-S-containing hydro-lyase [bacterium]